MHRIGLEAVRSEIAARTPSGKVFGTPGLGLEPQLGSAHCRLLWLIAFVKPRSHREQASRREDHGHETAESLADKWAGDKENDAASESLDCKTLKKAGNSRLLTDREEFLKKTGPQGLCPPNYDYIFPPR